MTSHLRLSFINKVAEVAEVQFEVSWSLYYLYTSKDWVQEINLQGLSQQLQCRLKQARPIHKNQFDIVR